MSEPADGTEDPFPITAGDSVNYIDKHGFQTGYFVRWNRNGAAVIKKPSGSKVTMERKVLRPCNDGRMVKLRGYIEYQPPAPEQRNYKTHTIKRKK